MWHEIHDQAEAAAFMESVFHFHDSCLRELAYISGAYVDDDLAMRPINEQRMLRVILQRQFEDMSVIELMFTGVRYLTMAPVDEMCTCEISDATLLIQEGRAYWCDEGGLSAEDMMTYDGTVICAEHVSWRPLPGQLGQGPFYLPADGGCAAAD